MFNFEKKKDLEEALLGDDLPTKPMCLHCCDQYNVSRQFAYGDKEYRPLTEDEAQFREEQFQAVLSKHCLFSSPVIRKEHLVEHGEDIKKQYPSESTEEKKSLNMDEIEPDVDSPLLGLDSDEEPGKKT